MLHNRSTTLKVTTLFLEDYLYHFRYFDLSFINPISSTLQTYLSCLHNPIHIFVVDLFPQLIKIRIFELKSNCRTTGRKPSNLGNPLFINVFSYSYFYTLDINTTHSTCTVCGNISTGCTFSIL